MTETFVPGVERLEDGRLVSWESLIDAGLGTPEMLAWDAANDARREAWRRSQPRSYWIRQAFWRRVASVFGALADWAEREHDRFHVTPDPGCRLCQDRE